ncbi:MAG: tRNA pseudouridine(38-40) synthase TruA [Armatimonadota bacterium]
MKNVKAVVEYDGTDFHGFQKQPRLRTVQGELERAAGKILGEPVKVIGAGRTDAGVHATGQVINLSVPDFFPTDRFAVAVNGALPLDLRIKSAEEVGEGFHARYSAKSRTYVYVVLNREVPSALLARYAWYLREQLDLPAMQAAGERLLGTRDFATFGMPDRAGASTMRTIFDIRIRRKRDAVFFIVKANAFLRGMARALVGTLVDCGRGRLAPGDIDGILAAGSRDAVKVIAPGRGLYLVRVEYRGDSR